jgi:ABC transport system ATP-binding/permease protein
MGANNSGREIASERLIFEKEKLSGLRPSSYIASKAVFLSVLVLAQSLWMGLFVHFVCGFPGDLLAQLAFLVMVNAAMTSICLGVSAWMATSEQASLVSIYLVGFQLPLSGAVLALPDWVGNAVRPFISAYWSWSGILQTLRLERYYDIVKMVAQTALSEARLCMWVLTAHIVTGLFLAWIGTRANRME